MRRLAILIIAATAGAACSPSPEAIHRRRVAEVITACIDNARQDLVSPSTFRAREMGATVIGAPDQDALAVRVPISGENLMGGRVDAEALCAQRVPGGIVSTVVVPR